MSTLVFTRRACLEGRRDKSTSIELCASMVAKLECHLINTQGPVTDPLTEELGYIAPLDFMAGKAPEIWSERDRKLEQAREARRERRSNKVPA